MKSVLGIILVIALIFLGLNIYINLKGKEILQGRIAEITGQVVTITDCDLLFPFDLRIENLSVGTQFKAKEAVLGAGLINIFNRRINLSKVILRSPEILISAPFKEIMNKEKEQPKEPQESEPVEDQSGKEESSDQESEKDVQVFIKRFIVENGLIQLKNTSESEQSVPVVFEGFNCKAKRIAVPPMAVVTEFDLESVVPGRDEVPEKGQIKGKGWFDLVNKDMKADITVEGLDSNLFSSFTSGGPNKFLKNTLINLTVNAESKSNDMTVNCKVKVKELRLGEEKNEKASLEDYILQGLRSMGEGIELKFSFKTRMDDFKLNSISLTGDFFNER